MTRYRAQATALLTALLIAAVIVVTVGFLMLIRTVSLAQAYHAPVPSCGCTGWQGAATVTTPQLFAAFFFSGLVLLLFAWVVKNGWSLYRRTKKIQHATFGPASTTGIFTHGLLSPQTYFPPHEQTRYTPDERAAIIAHERQHIRWRDPLALFLFACAGFVFGWIPGFGNIRRRFRLLLELDADAAAFHEAGSRKPLGTALLKTVERFQEREGLAVSFFGITEARLRRAVRLGVPLPLTALVMPFAVIALMVMGFASLAPRVTAQTTPPPRDPLETFVQCVGTPQCPKRIPEDTAFRIRTPASNTPFMSVVIVYDR